MTPVVATLSERERRDWLRLARSDGIGPRTFVGLLQRFGSAAAVIDAFPALVRRRPGLKLASPTIVDRELEAIAQRGDHLVALCEPDYPPALRVIDSAPPLITVRGAPAVLQSTMVAIVGARNASAAGGIFAERIAGQIGAAGFVVASGLARGIDARAHAGALATGTVAVLAGGLDKIYPPEHAGLAARIAEAGALISEMPPAWEARGRDFPRRNRIVSGLSLATVVVEAAHRSGSLITARLANEQGREVFAVPGSPLDPRAEGTNDLLRHGATLCTRAEDVIEALRAMSVPLERPSQHLASLWKERDGVWGSPDDDEGLSPPPAPPAENEAASLLALLGPTPVALDDLARLSGLTAANLRTMLLDLEFDGLIERHPGDLVSRAVGPS